MMGFKTIFKWVILIYQATIVSCAQPPNIIFILADDLVSRRLLCVFMLVTYTFFHRKYDNKTPPATAHLYYN